MRASEIETYKDLINFIKLEASKQTQVKRVIVLELPDEAFFKLVKLIKFCLKYNTKERDAHLDFPIDSKKFRVEINSYLTKVERK